MLVILWENSTPVHFEILTVVHASVVHNISTWQGFVPTFICMLVYYVIMASKMCMFSMHVVGNARRNWRRVPGVHQSFVEVKNVGTRT